MFSFLAKKRPAVVRINAQPIVVQPNETVLQAALRAGIDFPHSCRVGACASCKCRLLGGKVKSLTRSAYILSDEDLDQGCILACQTVPQGDAEIEVDLSARSDRRRVSGRVIGQDRLTHDIVHLRVQLDESLPYRAGQFAEIGLASLPGVMRSYSFAAAPQPDAQIGFFVRRVPGGVFSTRIHEAHLFGETVIVDGPLGDFWLRPGDAPLLLVAGGSGLAPLLAMLQQAAAEGCDRPVSLLFGAREERDLYAADQIGRLAAAWRAPFAFVPVLSGLDAASDWRGLRGMVAEAIPQHLAPGAQAYLCGPPPMVDDCSRRLRALGVRATDIHADRFTTQADLSAAA